MEPIVLNAALREGLGKEANRKLRASGGTWRLAQLLNDPRRSV